MRIVLLITIISLSVLFLIYLTWLLVFVFRSDIRELFSRRKKMPQEKPVQIQKTNIIGKSPVTFLDKIPEPEPAKPFREEEMIPVSEELMEETEIQPGDIELSEEEKFEIIRSHDKTLYWEEDEEFSTGCSIEEIYHASEVVTGEKNSDQDFAKAEATLKNVPHEFIELFSLHAVNNKKIKDMLSSFLDKMDDEPIEVVKLKDFVVKDYIA